MLARNETILKWVLYAAATVLCLAVQEMFLQRFTFWGVIPFIYPLLAAIPAAYEGPVPGTAFALAVGVASDLILPGPIPCFYTLVFPAVGLCAALLAQNLLPAGFLCSVAVSAVAFFLTDLFTAVLLWLKGSGAWGAAASLMLREFCVTAPLTVPATALYRAVYRRAHRDD